MCIICFMYRLLLLSSSIRLISSGLSKINNRCLYYCYFSWIDFWVVLIQDHIFIGFLIPILTVILILQSVLIFENYWWLVKEIDLWRIDCVFVECNLWSFMMNKCRSVDLDCISIWIVKPEKKNQNESHLKSGWWNRYGCARYLNNIQNLCRLRIFEIGIGISFGWVQN